MMSTLPLFSGFDVSGPLKKLDSKLTAPETIVISGDVIPILEGCACRRADKIILAFPPSSIVSAHIHADQELDSIFELVCTDGVLSDIEDRLVEVNYSLRYLRVLRISFLDWVVGRLATGQLGDLLQIPEITEKLLIEIEGKFGSYTGLNPTKAAEDLRILRAFKDKTYDLDWKTPIVYRTSTDGYQAKFLIDSDQHFLKLQCILSGRPLKDPWVEVIASLLAERLEIPCVKQQLVNVTWRRTKYFGVVSDVFKNEFYSYTRMSELHGKDIRDSDYNSLPIRDKFEFLANNMADFTKTNIDIWREYLRNMTLVDVMVGNNDRHFHNFGSFDLSRPAMLFDCGMGLFVDAPEHYTYDECLSQLYIQPWSEDPFDVVKELRLEGACKGLVWEDLLPMCPSDHARRYMKEAMSILCK